MRPNDCMAFTRIQLLLLITAKYLLFVHVTFRAACQRRDPTRSVGGCLLNALSSLSPSNCVLYKKKKKIKREEEEKTLCNQPLCSLFLLIYPPTISSTLSFQVSWSTAPWLQGNLVPFRVPTECVSSKAVVVVGSKKNK